MNIREKAQEMVELSEKATPGDWLIGSGDEESPDQIYVYDRPSFIEEYPSYTTVAEGLLEVDSSFIVNARNNAPDIARKLVEALDVLDTIAAYADVAAWPGEHRSWGEFSGPHECDGIRDARRFGREKKELERWEKAEKLTPEQAMERFEQLYVEEADEYGLTEDVISDHEDGGYPRMRIYGTSKQSIKLDVESILENATIGLRDDAYDSIPTARTEELQALLDAWAAKVAPLTETYYPDYRYAVVLPEVTEDGDEDGEVS